MCEASAAQSIEPELDAPLSQDEKRRKIVLTSDVGESLANMLEGFLTMNTADLFSDPKAREAAEGYASALKLSLEEAKEAEAAAATQLTVDAAWQRNLQFAIGLQRVIFGSVTTTEVALANVTAAKFRKNLKGIMLTRPPALLGRLPITGMRFKELVVPLASDYRVQVSIAEWGDRVDMTLTDEGVPIEGNDMVDAVIPAGCVRKRYSYKYGTVGVAVLTDGIRDAQQIYSVACPADQQPYRISFTLVAPSSITRVVGPGVDPTVTMLWSKAVPADARALAFASGVLSGGVQGPNNLVRLSQGISAAPDAVEQSQLLMLMLAHFMNRIILRYMGEQSRGGAFVIHAGAPLVHPRGDAVSVNGPGYKMWGGVSWQGRTKIEYTEWLHAFGDVPQLNFVFNRKAEVLNAKMANAIFLLSRGFPALVVGTQAAAAPAGLGNGIAAMKPWLSNWEMEGADRVNVIIKREDLTQVEALTFPIGDPPNVGNANAYPIALGTGLTPAVDDVPTEADFETLIVNHVAQLGLMEQFVRCWEMMYTIAAGKGGPVFGTGGLNVNEAALAAEHAARMGLNEIIEGTQQQHLLDATVHQVAHATSSSSSSEVRCASTVLSSTSDTQTIGTSDCKHSGRCCSNKCSREASTCTCNQG